MRDTVNSIFDFAFLQNPQGIGAVNTLIRGKDGQFQGYNTDSYGALSAIEDGLRLSGIMTSFCTIILTGPFFETLASNFLGREEFVISCIKSMCASVFEI
jgi:hypothetical protein